jgi:hypothetical protein
VPAEPPGFRRPAPYDPPMTFTVDDLGELASLAAEAWRSADGGDWSAPAGTLDWSCARTAAHAVDAVLAPALFLASRRADDYPPFGPVPVTGGTAADVADGVETAARVLAAVMAAAPPGSEAVIWRRPRPERRPATDFPPRAGLELVLHGHDVCTGLGVGFEPPAALCDRLRRHAAGWPHWRSPGWSPPTLAGEPWADLLRASGRA